MPSLLHLPINSIFFSSSSSSLFFFFYPLPLQDSLLVPVSLTFYFLKKFVILYLSFFAIL